MKIKNLLFVFAIFLSAFVKSQAPVANFSFAPAAPCSGNTVQVTDMSTGGATAWSYSFSTGAPATSTLQNPVVFFPAPGIHTITLVASNGTLMSAPVSQTIMVIPGANFFINPNTQTICASAGSLTFSAFAAGPGTLTYTWSSGPTTSAIVVSPPVTTIYTCVATATNGCTFARTATAVINPLPSVTITANPNGICGGGSSTLTASASAPGPFTYTWSTAANTSTISTNLTGLYSVTVTSSSTNCKGSQAFSLAPIASITLTATSNPTAICPPGQATLSVLGASSYTWSNAATTATTAVSPTVNTTYTVLGMAGTCTAITAVMVMVNSNPTVTAVANPTVICVGNPVNLQSTGANTYTWFPGPIIGGTVNAFPVSAVIYTVVGKNACGANAHTVLVNVNPSPTITVTSNAPALCPGDAAILTASSTATTYTWSTAANGTSITVSPTVTTNYTVSGTDANGCVSSATITETASPCTGIKQLGNVNASFDIYPNPNKGEFVLTTDNTNSELQIFDGVGKLVFKKTLSETQNKISISNLKDGIYYIRVTNGNNVINKKMVIEK